MHNLILKIHLYGALLCACYLILFGVSSLNFNHNFGKPGKKVFQWERELKVADEGSDRKISRRVRDRLGLIGYTIPWETYRDERGNLHFGLSRPGKQYTIHILFEQQLVKVREIRLGFWAVFNQLHGLVQLPSAPFIRLWGLYTELCFWVVLFAIGSGIYMWFTNRKERLMGTIVLGSAAGIFVLFVIYIWWRG